MSLDTLKRDLYGDVISEVARRKLATSNYVKNMTEDDIINLIDKRLSVIENFKHKDIALTVLKQRYGLKGSGFHTLKALGEIHGLSAQVITRIIRKLRRIIVHSYTQ